eukprot:11751703-Karenia_brevis.AAC.1
MAHATTSHMNVRSGTSPDGEQTGKGGPQNVTAVNNESKEFMLNEKRKGRVEEYTNPDSFKEDVENM